MNKASRFFTAEQAVKFSSLHEYARAINTPEDDVLCLAAPMAANYLVRAKRPDPVMWKLAQMVSNSNLEKEVDYIVAPAKFIFRSQSDGTQSHETDRVRMGVARRQSQASACD